jgi:hypothetical protein
MVNKLFCAIRSRLNGEESKFSIAEEVSIYFSPAARTVYREFKEEYGEPAAEFMIRGDYETATDLLDNYNDPEELRKESVRGNEQELRDVYYTFHVNLAGRLPEERYGLVERKN